MERQKTQNSQHNIEGEKQGWRTKLQDFETYYKATIIKTAGTTKRIDKQIKGTEKESEKQTHTNIVNRSSTKEQRQFNEGWSFRQMVPEQLNFYIKKIRI